MYNVYNKNNKEASRFLMIILFIVNFITIVIVTSLNAFGEYQEIYNKTHVVDLKTEGRLIKTEKIKTIAELDPNENKFRFSFYTKDYDKQDWNKEEKLIPLHIRHTNVAFPYMSILILHPENVKIIESKQKGYLVRDSIFSKKYGWEELIPYENHKNAQIAFGVTEKVIDTLLSKVPFGNVGYELLLEHISKQNREYYNSIFEGKKNYVTTMIPFHSPKDLIGYTETARSIEIPFDLSQVQGKQRISFWINPAFGNPSVSYSAGTWSPGFGRLEGIAINFNLSEQKDKAIKVTPTSKTFTNSIGMKFVSIPPGTFMMGSGISTLMTKRKYGGESHWYENEHPQYEVTLTKGFYLQTTEVTRGQWKSVMGTRPWSGQGCVRDNAHNPAVYISWNDCQEFIRRLNQKEGTNKYRLPTEAEWEYACRAGSITSFHFGDSDSILGDYAWCYKNTRDGGERYAHAVAQKQPNAWGLYDMHGNVYEWCQDWFYGRYTEYYVTDPKGPSSGLCHVLRGGAWGFPTGFCRSASRRCGSLGYLSTSGFRVAREF